MRRRIWLMTVLLSLTPLRPVLAEKVDMTSEELRATATHIISGQVLAVYQRTETAGDWKYTRFIAEIRVHDCEKGEQISKGDLVYVRYWHRAWVGKGRQPPSTSGHRGLPGEKESVRVYLARNTYDGFGNDNNDGGFNVIGANGFEKLKPAQPK
jgi:hypothetical protein